MTKPCSILQISTQPEYSEKKSQGKKKDTDSFISSSYERAVTALNFGPPHGEWLRVTDIMLNNLSNFTQLLHLNLSHCEKVTDRGALMIRNTTLVSLDISCCNVTDVWLRHIGKTLVNLQDLSIHESELPTPEGFQSLLALKKIKKLAVGRCPGLTDDFFKKAKFSDLEELDIEGFDESWLKDGDHLTDKTLVALQKFTKLKHVQAHGRINLSFKACKELHEVNHQLTISHTPFEE